MHFLKVSEVDELSNEEEARIQEVINFMSHAFPDLITPDWLYQCGFHPNPGNPPIFLFIFLSPFYFLYFIFY